MIVDGGKLKKWIKENKVCMPFRGGSVSLLTYVESIRVDDVSDFWEALEKCRVDTRIEAAIRFLEKEFDKIKTLNCPYGTYEELARNINLLKYLLNQPQNDMGYPGSTWADEELGLDKETTRSDAGTKN